MQGMSKRRFHWTRKVGTAVVGGAVVVIGIILIPLPGPGSLVILGGLAILATEFDAAQRLVDRMKARARQAFARVRPPEAQDEPAVD